MIRFLFVLAVLHTTPAAARELKLVTWNLSWLTQRATELPPDVAPKRDEDIATLRRYAVALDADVVAFSEVDGPEIAARVFPPDRYTIHITQDRVLQRAGFAIRRGLDFIANPDLVGLDLYQTARFHLRSGADITLTLPGGRLRLLAVHLKSGCRSDPLTGPDGACATLARQLPHLQGWAAQRAAEQVPFAMMGDFNRWMEGRDAFLAGLQQSAPLLRPDAGQHSPCWGGAGFLDHILLGGAARAWLRPDSLRVMVYRETTAEMKERLSDHCPVSVRLDIPD